MPFQSKKAKLQLSEIEREMLLRISHSRTEDYRRVERAKILLSLCRRTEHSQNCSSPRNNGTQS